MKTMKHFMMLLSPILIFASSKDDDETTIVPVKSVTISKTILALAAGGSEMLTGAVVNKPTRTIEVGIKETLTATIAPVDATKAQPGIDGSS